MYYPTISVFILRCIGNWIYERWMRHCMFAKTYGKQAVVAYLKRVLTTKLYGKYIKEQYQVKHQTGLQLWKKKSAAVGPFSFDASQPVQLVWSH